MQSDIEVIKAEEASKRMQKFIHFHGVREFFYRLSLFASVRSQRVAKCTDIVVDIVMK